MQNGRTNASLGKGSPVRSLVLNLLLAGTLVVLGVSAEESVAASFTPLGDLPGGGALTIFLPTPHVSWSIA